ncbi:MAG TPA: PQQ-dependent sugar dehydrogenase [Planctomycetota bacterium]|nr:PQQ-dependent sugar dehydrogenase [Planctomycetota bacterium]
MRPLTTATSLLLVAALGAGEAPPDYRYHVETLVEGMPQPMELEIAPDGRIFFNEYGGKLRIYHPDTKQTVDAGQIEVFNGQENGFLGFALDPQFATNHWIYCLHSPKDFSGQHLTRFTMTGDQLDLASAKVLLTFEEQRKECCHHAGSVEFGPDGLLYLSTGDNTHPHGDSQGYAPIDQRPGQYPWDAQKSASNTYSYNGKILRIKPKPDGTYEIPKGNLFPPGTDKTRPEIYVMGCRNPWRMSVDEQTGIVYWGEVGPDAGDDGPRGSRGYDEINQAKQAGNFGWPYFVGNNFVYHAYDYATKTVGAAFDPLHPINESPNNTGLRELPPAQPAMIWWPYRNPREFTEMGDGGRTACAGPVFHFRPEFEQTNGFPKEFDGCLLFWDWERPTIRWARMDGAAHFQRIEPFTSAVVTGNKAEQIEKLKPAIDAGAALIQRPVDAVFGHDGALYLLDYGETWGANKDAKLVKITYQRGNLPPIAKASATPTAGREPLTVQLSAAGSKDHEGDELTYAWKLIASGATTAKAPTVATTADATITVTDAGNYRAELTVTDAHGASGNTSVALVVGNSAPTVAFNAPQDGDFFTPGKPVAYSVTVSDQEDGTSTEKANEFSARTLVSSTFLRADGKAAPAEPGFAMMKASDCFNCHAIDVKIIGPALTDIAAKYRGQPSALDASVQRVRSGSTKVWGEIPMLPHPQHTTDEVTIMVRWIYSLEKGKGGPALTRGLTGDVIAPKEDKAGTFRLEATYADAGRAPAGSLSGKASVTLRSRRLEAESADVQGPKKMGNVIGSIDHGHFVRFANIDLAEVGSLTARAASGNVGGRIEFRVGSLTGDLIGSVEVPNTGGWDKWIEPSTPLAATAPKARAEVYAVFVNPGKGGLMNLDWVQFNAP